MSRSEGGSRFPHETMSTMRQVLIDKLRPDRFSAMSGKMAAIVGYILNEPFSDPAISELVVTSDGFVLRARSARTTSSARKPI
jgi:hypothetical protein